VAPETAVGWTGLPVEAFLTFVASAKQVAKTGGRGKGGTGEKASLGNAEMLNAERAIANTKTIGEAANRSDGVKRRMLRRTPGLGGTPVPFSQVYMRTNVRPPCNRRESMA